MEHYEEHSQNFREKLYSECVNKIAEVINSGKQNVAESVFLSISTLHTYSVLAEYIPNIITSEQAKALLQQKNFLDTVYKNGWMQSDYLEPKDYVLSDECKDFIRGIADWTISSIENTNKNALKVLSEIKKGVSFTGDYVDTLANSEFNIEINTSLGVIPLNDYLEIMATQNGYNSYSELRDSGLSISIPCDDIMIDDNLFEVLQEQQSDNLGVIDADIGDKILDTKTNTVGTVEKIGLSGNYRLIYVDFGKGLREINPIDDAQRIGRYRFADEQHQKDNLSEKLAVADERAKSQSISQGNKYQPEL